jgi:ankyrin repeat protein
MIRFHLAVLVATSYCVVPLAFSQTGTNVSFERDVQPILRQNCVGCHGPKVQNSGLRVDRRSSVLKPGARRVVPGSFENSFLYHRISGGDFGVQMPPTGPLKPEQIQIIKAWIEQGADWPDSLANELELPPLDPKAIAAVEILRTGHRERFIRLLTANPKLLNARGPEGSTPFMYAVLYADAPFLQKLIKLGADVNKRNDAGATALVWAALDLEKTRVLLANGADVNARTDNSRTPLMVAAGRPGGSAVVDLLLAKGANPNPNLNPVAESSPLFEASIAGDAASMQALLEHGAATKEIAGPAIAVASAAGCARCVEMLLARKPDRMQSTIALQQVAILDNPALVKTLLRSGADVNAADPLGRTALMYAAISDALPVEQMKILIENGADVNAKSRHLNSGDTGLTALDLAGLHGITPVADTLVKHGASGTVAARPQKPGAIAVRNTGIRSAVSASLALLQRADADFVPKAGCFSCHNQSITAMAVGIARKRGFAVDEKTAARQLKVNAGALESLRDMLHQGFFLTGFNASPAILSWVLMGLDAEGYKPDLATDAAAMYIQSQQMPDGHWAFGPEARPPLCADQLGQTVLSLRGIQLYRPAVNTEAFAKAIKLATAWIAAFHPQTNYDLAWKLQGLVWGGAAKDEIVKAKRALLAVQRGDGGWSDLPSMASGPFTTGLAMMALNSSGMPVSDSAYQRGIRYLLDTQLEDGSWHVRSRAAGFQPYFENGYPHGVDQWISAASSGLATIALVSAVETDRQAVARR